MSLSILMSCSRLNGSVRMVERERRGYGCTGLTEARLRRDSQVTL
ncbi:MAG: hypothetical protein NTX17_08225 [Candidatus Eisenbacteria bacterium]|nr:hypothetical protein [Candidatus Eisenbacteria bacterium]